GATRTILYGPDGEPISAVNRLPVEATLTGRKVQTTITTLVNAESVPPEGSTSYVPIGATDEDLVFVLVNIDQQPWSLQSRVPWRMTGNTTVPFYPRRSSVQTPFPDVGFPCVSLLLGVYASDIVGLADEGPQSLLEALQ